MFGNPNPVTFSKEELLNFRQCTPDSLPSFFTNSEAFLEILVGGVAAVCRTWKRRQWGKWGGALVRLRQRRFRIALPSIHLPNLHSLPNKMDELLLLNGTNKDFSHSTAFCSTETWPSETILHNGLRPSSFHLLRANHVLELSRRTRGSSICFYVNEGCCTDFTVLAKHCNRDLETLFINYKPFYSPREFSSFILVSVYIQPQTSMKDALQTMAKQILRE